MVFFFRQLLVTTGIGPTLVEISDHPLLPAGSTTSSCRKPGGCDEPLEVLLVCDEEATYRQGTRCAPKSIACMNGRCIAAQDFHVRQDVPFEARLLWRFRWRNAHSFKSQHNEINWSLVVKGKASGWPEYRRAFPLIVYPGGTVRNGKRA